MMVYPIVFVFVFCFFGNFSSRENFLFWQRGSQASQRLIQRREVKCHA